MKLNLVNKEASDIEYTINKYPDGQQNITLNTFFLKKFGINDSVTIYSRLNNWKDLEIIVATVASLKEAWIERIHLYVPYILGARSDRKFEEGSNNYLKTVICPVLNRLGLQSITNMDSHSDVLEACLNNFRKQNNHKLVKWALEDINNKLDAQENTVFISPDQGAAKKIYKVLEHVNYKGDPIICSKQRDEKGNLTKVLVPLDKDQIGKDCVIIDDICDGGATFINIAKAIDNFEKD